MCSLSWHILKVVPVQKCRNNYSIKLGMRHSSMEFHLEYANALPFEMWFTKMRSIWKFSHLEMLFFFPGVYGNPDRSQLRWRSCLLGWWWGAVTRWEGQFYKTAGPAALRLEQSLAGGSHQQQASTGLKEQERNQAYPLLNRTKVSVFPVWWGIIGPAARGGSFPVEENN